MNKFWIFVALVVGGWWYVTHHVNFDSTLEYTRSHKDKDWAPKVDYWIGIAYYQRTDYDHAKAAFNQILTEYPTSYYSAHALLKLSEMAEDNREWAASRDALSKYLEDYPDDPERKIAERRFEIIRNR